MTPPRCYTTAIFSPRCLDLLRANGPAGITREDILKTGYGGVLTIERRRP